MFQHTIERIYVGDAYADIDRGIYLIRGESVVLLGEIVCWARVGRIEGGSLQSGRYLTKKCLEFVSEQARFRKVRQ